MKLDLRDEAALRAACAAMTAAKNGFLVQSMVKGGVELVVGIKRDPQCGPVLLVGLGGVLVEVLRDTALALAPVGKLEARRMLESLKGFKLLQGYRGAPAVGPGRGLRSDRADFGVRGRLRGPGRGNRRQSAARARRRRGRAGCADRPARTGWVRKSADAAQMILQGTSASSSKE